LVFITGGDRDLDCSSKAGVSSELDSTRLSLLLTNESLSLILREIGVLIDEAPSRWVVKSLICNKSAKKVALVFNVYCAIGLTTA
jgi:hypothetical protein